MEKPQIARAVSSDENEIEARPGMIQNRLGMDQVSQVSDWA